MKIDGQHFDPTTLGMSHAISYVHHRYDAMRGRTDALGYGARELRRIADEMDRIAEDSAGKTPIALLDHDESPRPTPRFRTRCAD
jgi:hypothetical protein